MKSERSQRRAIHKFLCSSAIVSVGVVMASTAYADAPPPERFVVDQNGVDMARGTYRSRQVELSIGAGRTALNVLVDRTSNGPSEPDFDLGIYGDPNTELEVAVFGRDGPVSERFSKSGGLFFSELGDGATLTVSGTIYTLKLSNGAQYKYDAFITSDYSSKIARVTEIKLASGEVLSPYFTRLPTCTNPNQSGC